MLGTIVRSYTREGWDTRWGAWQPLMCAARPGRGPQTDACLNHWPHAQCWCNDHGCKARSHGGPSPWPQPAALLLPPLPWLVTRLTCPALPWTVTRLTCPALPWLVTRLTCPALPWTVTRLTCPALP